MFLHLFLVHYHELSASRYIHRQNVLLLMLRILPVVLDDSDNRHLLQQLLQLCLRLLGLLCQLRKSNRLAHVHAQCHFRHLIGNHTCKSPVFRIVYRELLHTKLVRNTVGNLFPEL